MLGQAYEYLIKKFADATNKKAGEFYTPRSVVRLMVKILDPERARRSTIRPAAPAACCSGRAPRQGARRRRQAAAGASSTARRKTSPPRPSPA